MKSARRLQTAGQTLLRAFLLLPLALPSAAQISGSVQTTLPTGVVQGNIYASKTQVFCKRLVNRSSGSAGRRCIVVS